MVTLTSAAATDPAAASNAALAGNAGDGPAGTAQMASQETFLKLLVAQIKNQDPLSPMDSVQFVSQLAQFSSLEQLIGLRSELQALESKLSAPATGTRTTPPATQAGAE